MICAIIAGQEQVVPSCSPIVETGEVEVSYGEKDVPGNKDGIKILELFAGDDIFAHEE